MKGVSLVRKRISDFLNSHRLKKRLVTFMIILIFIPVFTLNIIFSFLYSEFYNKKITEGYEFFQRESHSNLNYKLNLYQAMVDRTAYNHNIASTLLSVSPNDMLSAYHASKLIDAEVENITLGNSMEEVYQFLVFPLNPNIRVMGKYMSNYEHISNESWILKTTNKTKHIFIEKKLNNTLLSIAQVMYNAKEGIGEIEPLAIVKAEIKLDSILKNSINDKKSDFGIEILSGGQVCYTYKPFMTSLKKQNQYYFIEKNLIGEELKIRYIFDKSYQTRVMTFIILSFSLIGLLLLLVLTLAIVRFSDAINLRIEEIFNKIKKLEKGDFQLGQTLDGDDEFADIDRGISKMADKLKKSINERYIMETERKKAELLALQMQINPHFMFNTLETINSFAKQARCSEISAISRMMAEILRYNISNNDEGHVRLKQEIEHITSYLGIQKIRYGNRFDIIYDIPKELEDSKILKFILQPIVENTIKYAIQAGNDNYLIAITAEAADGILTITIQDDGVGMSAERLEMVRKNLNSQNILTTKSIGLKNVHSRIQIAYGTQYGVSIDSKEKVGTRVQIQFPLEY